MWRPGRLIFQRAAETSSTGDMRFVQMKGRQRDGYREVAHRLRAPRVEVQRGTSGQTVWGAVAWRTRARSRSRAKPFDLSLGSSCGGERCALTTARDWRKTASRIRWHVHFEPGQVGSGDGLGTIAQNRVARDQPEAVGRLLAVLGIGLDGAAPGGAGSGFRAATASSSIHRAD